MRCSFELDASDVTAALRSIGAATAAHQLSTFLDRIGVALPAASQGERRDVLDRFLTDELNEWDCLSREADDELMAVLAAHVGKYQAFYLDLPGDTCLPGVENRR